MQLVREHVQAANAFIGLQVMPLFDCPGDDFQWPVIKREQLFNAYNTKKARNGTFPEKETRFDWTNGQLHKFGLRVRIDRDAVKKYGNWFDAERAETLILADDMRRDHELKVASKLFNRTTFAGKTGDVSTEWSTASTSTPVDDVKAARDAVFQNCGMVPDTAVMSYTVRSNLGNCKQIRDRLVYTQGLSSVGPMDDAAIAAALGVKRIIVGQAQVNSADTGQTASTSEIWDKEFCLICKISEGQNLEAENGLGVGRTGIWRASTADMFEITSWVDPETDMATKVQCAHFAEPLMLTTLAGYLLGNITA